MGGKDEDGPGKEGRGARVLAFLGALATVLGVALAGWDLYDRVGDLRQTVDYQAEQLALQREALANQEEELELQRAELAQQARQFLIQSNGSAIEDRRALVEHRLAELDDAIDEVASAPTLASVSAADRLASARELQRQAQEAYERAWREQGSQRFGAALQGYEEAEGLIDQANEALEPPPLGTTVGPDPADAANQALSRSLSVTRDGSTNTLSWNDVTGEDGYQVWRGAALAPSYEMVAKLPADTESYPDLGAPLETAYVVTAIVGGEELTAADVNGGDVPGHSGVPDGKEPGETAQAPAPGPGAALLVGVLALAALLAGRRRA